MLKRWRPGALARSSIAVMGWHSARLVAQLAWVVSLIHAIGVDGYGSFSGLAGLAIAASGIAGAGFGWRLYQDVARDRSLFSQRWAQANLALVWTSAVLAVALVLIGHHLFPHFPFTMLLAVAVSELALMPFVHQIICSFAAHGRVAIASAVPVVVSVARLLAVFLLLVSPLGRTVESYSYLHLVLTGAAVWVLRIAVLRILGPVDAKPEVDRAVVVEGLGFASVWASGTALTSLDKVVVLRVGGAQAAGEYTGGFRFASLAALPVEAMATAVLPRLFQEGGQRRASRRLIELMLVATLGYGLVAAAILWLAAPRIPLILHGDTEGLVACTRALALYVPAYCLYLLGIHVLLGYGWKRWRFATDMLGLALMVSLMTLWIPERGALGAANALVSSEYFLAVLVWLRVAAGISAPRSMEERT